VRVSTDATILVSYMESAGQSVREGHLVKVLVPGADRKITEADKAVVQLRTIGR
jgi:hypothetical protein